ncbi:hypothetical protein SDC9_124094 [bioreactor metagenome]|uniref:Uncharacterized protein n=1 Tax=bioreactor metagenome TaxID=1076179 RepID=A0A645CJH6_9ZZZZ
MHHKDWNYLRYANGSHELYNVKNDENEYYNLADKPEYKYMVDSLSKYLPATWYTGPAEVIVNSISEDFSSAEWDSEFLRLNPTYIRPTAGTNFGAINSADRYFDKYLLKGAVIGTKATPNCAIPEITHGDANVAIAFRLANTGSSSYMELPTMNNAGNITLHVRNGNATADGKITLQKYDAEDWSTITELPVRFADSYNATSIDEVISYPVNLDEEVKLRVHGGDKFVQVFRVDVTPFGFSGLNNSKADIFGLAGRKITVQHPTRLSLYNTMGVLVYEKEIENQTGLPAYVGNGIFLAKTGMGTQKIFIKN